MSSNIVANVITEKQASIIGLIAGNGVFPLLFAKSAKAKGHQVIAVCHVGETDPAIEEVADKVIWIKVGQLGTLLSTFVDGRVKEVAMAGGINRVRLFGGVKLDLKGAALLARLRSTKDDVIMRGIASELEQAGIEVISCTRFLEEALIEEQVYTSSKPSAEEWEDIRVGVEALQAISSQDIGQLVVVREGVVVAVEAVEGSDAAIRRGGELGGKGSVVVKFSKVTQDMRFDVPTIGVRTLQTMVEVGCRVLAAEAGKCLMLERDEMVKFADKHKIVIVGCRNNVSV